MTTPAQPPPANAQEPDWADRLASNLCACDIICSRDVERVAKQARTHYKELAPTPAGTAHAGWMRDAAFEIHKLIASNPEGYTTMTAAAIIAKHAPAPSAAGKGAE